MNTHTHTLLQRQSIMENEIWKCEARLKEARSHLAGIKWELSRTRLSETPKNAPVNLPAVKRKVVSALSNRRNQTTEDLAQILHDTSENALRSALKELRKQGAIQFSTKENWNLNRE